MRNAFADELTQLGNLQPEIVLLSGDIGNRLFDRYKQAAPDRFFNCGVAEANMISVAAGLALSGLRPIAYTITPFVTYRCFEQIRVDLCYHNLPVVLVGVGAGLAYASLGSTHEACEDVACLRSLPNMSILCPGDAYEVRAALRLALEQAGPVYIRLGKKNEPTVHEQIPSLALGKGLIVEEGDQICLFATGVMLPFCQQACRLLGQHGIGVRLVSLPCIKPLDQNLLQQAFTSFAAVVTVEEHSLIGGLGSAVAEWWVDKQDQSHKAGLIRIGTQDRFIHKAGSQSYKRSQFGLTPDQIAEVIIDKSTALLAAGRKAD